MFLLEQWLNNKRISKSNKHEQFLLLGNIFSFSVSCQIFERV